MINYIDYKLQLIFFQHAPLNLSGNNYFSIYLTPKICHCICSLKPKLCLNFQPSSLTFSRNHGSNIVLSNHGRTAERIRAYDQGGLVVCDTPMLVNRLYEVTFINSSLNLGERT